MVQTCYHRFDESFSGSAGAGMVQVNCHQLHTSSCVPAAPTCQVVSHWCNSSPQASSGSFPPYPSSQSDSIWYPDSGATNHITPEVSNLVAPSSYTDREDTARGPHG